MSSMTLTPGITFVILKGTVLMDLGSEPEANDEACLLMKEGDAVEIPQRLLHSFWGVTDAVILEISTEDITEDSYRNNSSKKLSWKERRLMKRIVKAKEKK